MKGKPASSYWIMFGIVLPFALAHAASSPGVLKLDLGHGNGGVSFLAIGKPSFLKIHGKGDKPSGAFTMQGSVLKGAAQFNLASLDTGIETRNDHMKNKYLEVEKYPRAELRLTRVGLSSSLGKKFEIEKVAFDGMLTLHGVTRSISGLAKIKRTGGQIAVDARFSVKISDFKIAVPSFAGVTVADEVQITVHTESPFSEN